MVSASIHIGTSAENGQKMVLAFRIKGFVMVQATGRNGVK
jgi:hypothetical protein